MEMSTQQFIRECFLDQHLWGEGKETGLSRGTSWMVVLTPQGSLKLSGRSELSQVGLKGQAFVFLHLTHHWMLAAPRRHDLGQGGSVSQFNSREGLTAGSQQPSQPLGNMPVSPEEGSGGCGQQPCHSVLCAACVYLLHNKPWDHSFMSTVDFFL